MSDQLLFSVISQAKTVKQLLQCEDLPLFPVIYDSK